MGEREGGREGGREGRGGGREGRTQVHYVKSQYNTYMHVHNTLHAMEIQNIKIGVTPKVSHSPLLARLIQFRVSPV